MDVDPNLLAETPIHPHDETPRWLAWVPDWDGCWLTPDVGRTKDLWGAARWSSQSIARIAEMRIRRWPGSCPMPPVVAVPAPECWLPEDRVGDVPQRAEGLGRRLWTEASERLGDHGAGDSSDSMPLTTIGDHA